ncbi:MAG: hypothetical protein PHN49_08510, partial [Candidatus Omnitrophica bacterium]|nr:hypothetical protein [Candidatus Omnitrophota bacterium]
TPTGIIREIENRRGQWIAFKAEVQLNFSRGQQTASCNGEMVYNRLDEKLLLECSDSKKNVVFAFKAIDRDYQLYLPSRKTVFSGNVFELQDSPEIESHLKPLDLYRALKPLVIPAQNASIETVDQNSVTLRVLGENQRFIYLARRILANRQGDIMREIYYSFQGEPVVTIYRNKFQKSKLADYPNRKNIFYPKEVLIENGSSNRKTLLEFEDVKFYSFLAEQNWDLNVPADTQFIHLKE